MKLLKPATFLCLPTSNICNLSCPSCPLGRIHGQEKVKWMSMEMLCKILDKAETESRVPMLNFAAWSEPTLNPELPKFIREVRMRGIPVWLTTNLSKKIDIPELMSTGLESVCVSVSGASQEIADMDHPGSDVDMMRRQLAEMAQCRASWTKLRVLFHRYKYNEQDEKAWRMFCMGNGIEFVPSYGKLMGNDKMVEAFRGSEEHKAVTDRWVVSVEEARQRGLKHTTLICRSQHREIALDVDANIWLCGTQRKYQIGNYLELPLKEIRRRMKAHPFCKECQGSGAQAWIHEATTWRRHILNNLFAWGYDTVGRFIDVQPSMDRRNVSGTYLREHNSGMFNQK